VTFEEILVLNWRYHKALVQACQFRWYVRVSVR